MVIFSMGGLTVRRQARCRTGLVGLEGPPHVEIQPTVAGHRPGVGADDVELAAALWTWVALPLQFPLEPGRRQDITVPDGWPAAPGVHTLTVDDDGAVTRHEEGDLVHDLSGHCDFGGVLVATRRRTRRRTHGRHGLPLGWADLVAAHVIPTKTLN